MNKNIYFALNDGKLVTNYELAKMAYTVNGTYIEASDLEAIREYAVSCKGIWKEVNPSIKVCLKNGEKIKAIKIYRDRHPGIGLREAVIAVNNIEEKIKVVSV